MKFKILKFSAYITLLCSSSFAETETWKDLVTSSDFIVIARAVKIEEVSENQYRTTFSVKKNYKGTPPETISIDWEKESEKKSPAEEVMDVLNYKFSIEDLSCDFILIAKQTDAGLVLSSERFLRKRKPQRHFGDNHIQIRQFGTLPPELEIKVISKRITDDYTVEFILWDDIKSWFDSKYLKNNS
ncbi:hypothetical protein P4C99_15030 [Pontiellaceae bacterium B1224]|nr:hypothetical protein [Pontiellaceae bacterium B1224]